jgi:hypothetical protein
MAVQVWFYVADLSTYTQYTQRIPTYYAQQSTLRQRQTTKIIDYDESSINLRNSNTLGHYLGRPSFLPPTPTTVGYTSTLVVQLTAAATGAIYLTRRRTQKRAESRGRSASKAKEQADSPGWTDR